MRKIDIERSRDLWKETLKAALRLNTIMSQRYCEWADALEKRNKELEAEIKKLKEKSQCQSQL